MKAIKWLLYGAGGLVVLALLAVATAFLVVDGAFVKSRLETAMKERGRTLFIEGEPKFSLFPTLRLGLGKTTLSEPNSDKNFAALDSLQVAVRVMPLLSGEVAVDTLALSGLRLNVVRGADGRFNFDDFAAGKPATAPVAPREPVKLRVAELSIERANIAYADQASGQALTVADLSVKTGRLEDDTPTPVSVSATVSGKRPEVALKAQVAGSMRMNLARQSFAFSKLDAKVSGNAATLRGLDLRLTGDLAADAGRQEYIVETLGLQLKGTLSGEALGAALSAPKLRITSSKAEGQAVTGNFTLRGPQRNIEAKLNMAAVEGSATSLSVPSLALEFGGQIGGNALKGQLATPIKANLKDGVWELAKVVGNLSLGRSDSALKAQLAGAAVVNTARQMVAVRGLDVAATGTYETLRGLDLRMTGDMTADAQKREYTADKVALQAKGTLDRDAFAASFEAPRLRVTPAKAEGQAVTGAVTVKGPQRDIDAKLSIAAVEGSANSLSIPAFKLELASNISGNGIKGTVSTPVQANLSQRSWELPKLVANLTFSGPAIPQKTVTLPIQGALRADHTKQTASGELTTKFDETNVNAKFGATRFEPLVATFDVGIDKLDLDRYLPPEQKSAPKTDERVDLTGLHGKTVSGKFAAGALTVKRVKMQNVKADVKLANGKLDVAPHSLNLYGGSLNGSLSADANGNRIAAKETAQNVAVGPLLRDAAQKDVLEGRGNLTLDVQTAGGTMTALKKALGGNARVEIRDGAIKGVNLAESARNVKSMVGMKSQKADPSQKTDFSEMSASFKITNGVARNDDLKGASPFFRLGGAGNLDVGNNLIDYLAKCTLAATAKGQGGRDAKDVAGVTIPIKLTGALDNPNWNVDYSGLLGSAGGGIVETVKKGVGGAGSGVGGVGNAVRGLFKR
jgi:AsmA protein